MAIVTTPLTTTDAGVNKATRTLTGSPKQARVLFTGTFTGVLGPVEVSYTGNESDYVSITGVREDNGASFNGVIGSSKFGVVFNVGGYGYIRFRPTQISSGPVNVGIDIGANFDLPLGITPIQLSSVAQVVSSTSANAFTVGPSGATYPTFNVDASAGSAATGFGVVAAAAGSGVKIAPLSSAADEDLIANAKGAGKINLGSVSTGGILASDHLTFADAKNIVLNTTTGSIIATGTTQKLAFWNATPIVQPANTVDYVTMLTNLGLRATGGTASATFPGKVVSTSPTLGVGYATGAGGAVTQATNRTTGVTLNKTTGQITTNNTSLAAAAFADFIVSNSAVAATDVVVVNIVPGGTGSPRASIVNVAAGSFTVRVTNDHASTADTSADVVNFAVIKGVAA